MDENTKIKTALVMTNKSITTHIQRLWQAQLTDSEFLTKAGIMIADSGDKLLKTMSAVLLLQKQNEKLWIAIDELQRENVAITQKLKQLEKQH